MSSGQKKPGAQPSPAELAKSKETLRWSTQRVDEIIAAMDKGYETPINPFWDGKPEWRAGGILFDYTPEEVAELKRCAEDVIYFANKYCFVMTEEGIRNIALRDYQVDILRAYQAHNKVVFVAPRQIGKCFSFATTLTVKQNGRIRCVSIGELYYEELAKIRQLTPVEIAKKLLWEIYSKYPVKIIPHLIHLIEQREYNGLNLDENNPNKKILNTIKLEDEVLALSHNGFQPVTELHLTQPYSIYRLSLANGYQIECADEHIVFDSKHHERLVCELAPGDLIKTDAGVSAVLSVEKIGPSVSMFDCSIDSADHSYYTNGVLSHNTITTAIFLSWYLLFNTDKNLMILANNGATSEELVDKVKTVLSNLPFFLKPGINVNNVMTMKFDNGCRLFGRTTTKTSGIGFTIHFLYMDEFAHIHPNFIEPFYRAVYPTIAASKSSRVIITSTPNGMNKFYDIYTAAMLPEGDPGKNDYFPLRVDWWQVPGRDEAWMKREIANLGSEEDFNQEYNCQFLASSKLLLDSENLTRIKASTVEYEWREIDAMDDVLPDRSKYEHLRWHPRFDLDSISPNDRFVISVDTAGGGGADYTVANIFKLVPMSLPNIQGRLSYRDESDFLGVLQVGIFRSNRAGVEELQPIMEALLYQVFGEDRTAVVLEMDFKGNILYEKMSTHDRFFSAMFVHTRHTENAKIMRPGIRLNPKNKLEYCWEMRKLVKAGRIMLTEKTTFNELAAFGLTGKGSYCSQTGHDDIAMTVVNLCTYFSSTQYISQMEDIYDKLPRQYREAIAEKLNALDDGDQGGPIDNGFLRDMMQ